MTDRNRIILPDVSEDENALVNRLLAQLTKKAERNRLRVSYYDGKRAIRQVGTVIPPMYYKLGIVLGWSAKAVDVLARRCNLDGFVWPDGDLESLGLAEVWDDNALDIESNAAIVSTLLHGVSFVINTRGVSGEPTSLIHIKDALNATGDWNLRTRQMSNLLSVTDRDDDGKPSGFALYLDGKTITAEYDGRKWTVDRSEHAFGVPVEALVHKRSLGRPFGTSRIDRHVMGLQDQALRTVLRLEGHADVFSFPEYWLLGADQGALVNSDGSPKTDWQTVLGRVKAIPDDEDGIPGKERAEVQRFESSSPQAHIDMLKFWAGQFAGHTDLPVTALGVQAETNTTTADGSDNAERQLVAEAEGATDDWSPALRRSMKRALAIANGLSEVPEEWRSIGAKWRSPLYVSRAAQADAGMKQLAADPSLVGTEVGYELLGLSEQQIKRVLAEKRRMSVQALIAKLPTAEAATDPAVQQRATRTTETDEAE